VEYLYRVSYNPNNPNELLISGQYEDGSVFSWVYNPGLKVLKSIKTDGVAAYKCAFFNRECFYAERVDGFEDRHIVKAKSIEMTELPAEKYITATTEPTYVRSRNPVFE